MSISASRAALLLALSLLLPSCGSRPRCVAKRARTARLLFFQDASTFGSGTGPWYDRTPRPVPANWPPIAAQVRLAYDETRQRVLLFGGGVSNGYAKNNDLFEWNGDLRVSWAKLHAHPFPVLVADGARRSRHGLRQQAPEARRVRRL